MYELVFLTPLSLIPVITKDQKGFNSQLRPLRILRTILSQVDIETNHLEGFYMERLLNLKYTLQNEPLFCFILRPVLKSFLIWRKSLSEAQSRMETVSDRNLNPFLE